MNGTVNYISMLYSIGGHYTVNAICYSRQNVVPAIRLVVSEEDK